MTPSERENGPMALPAAQPRPDRSHQPEGGFAIVAGEAFIPPSRRDETRPFYQSRNESRFRPRLFQANLVVFRSFRGSREDQK
jgi:hypothetical protein